MKFSKAVVAVVAFVGVAAAACAESPEQARPGAAADAKWACAPDQIATTISQLAAGGGYETTDAALVATAKLLASDGVADREALMDAASAAGDSERLAGDSERLVIEGEVVADVAFAKLDDGTWTVSTVQYCSPPPGEAGSPAPTPTNDAGEANS